MRLRKVTHLVLAGIQAPGRDFMQQRLPQMGPGTLHQGDARTRPPAEAVAEPGDELQPRRAAAHHDDPMQILASNRHAAARCLDHGT